MRNKSAHHFEITINDLQIQAVDQSDYLFFMFSGLG